VLNRLLAALVISTLIVGCCFALSERSLAASQDMSAHAAFDAPPTPPRGREPTPVDLQMRAREHHARVNMILYTGRFGDGERAATRGQLDAIALTVKTAAK